MHHTVIRALWAAALLAGWARPADALVAVEDHLPEFLVAVGSGPRHAMAAYEAAQARALDPLFYRDRSPEQKLLFVRQSNGLEVPTRALGQFALRWRSDLESVARRLEPISGTSGLKVSMWYCLDPRPWVYVPGENGAVLALNARHLLPYHPTRTKMAFAKAFLDAMASQGPEETAEALTLSRRLQLEGLKLAMAERAVPGRPWNEYLDTPPSHFSGWHHASRAMAHSLLQALDSPESAIHTQRFFGSGFGTPWPPGAGRYLAFVMAASATRSYPPAELARMPSRDYMFLVRPVLEDMADHPPIGYAH
ncbi:MAG: hypothetical protein VKP62_16060 [Candidatus Sericytochromatia bacterium]|nr:hypothetical protein [Candidatus Sericytochromatia bacterium]